MKRIISIAGAIVASLIIIMLGLSATKNIDEINKKNKHEGTLHSVEFVTEEPSIWDIVKNLTTTTTTETTTISDESGNNPTSSDISNEESSKETIVPETTETPATTAPSIKNYETGLTIVLY